ncbi:MAG: hypothetical protein ACJATV_001507 [Granulosicoccus sp.]|jgi:hypothetical protein
MNSLVWQSACITGLLMLVVWNRSEIGDPKWPLIGAGVTVCAWLLLALTIIVSSLWRFSHGVQSNTLSMVSLVLAVVPIFAVVAFVIAAQKAPAIHDISTDTANPPEFVLAEQARHHSHNSLSYDSANVPIQRQAYPHIKPVIIGQEPQVVMVSVMAAVNKLGWQLHGNDSDVGSTSDALVVEAYIKTPLLGFVDDVVVRITPEESGTSRIDVRSVSRIGVSDLGVNAKRIHLFLNVLSRQLNDQE